MNSWVLRKLTKFCIFSYRERHDVGRRLPSTHWFTRWLIPTISVFVYRHIDICVSTWFLYMYFICWCVRDVNIIRQTHLNRLKILTSSSFSGTVNCVRYDFIEVFNHIVIVCHCSTNYQTNCGQNLCMGQQINYVLKFEIIVNRNYFGIFTNFMVDVVI